MEGTAPQKPTPMSLVTDRKEFAPARGVLSRHAIDAGGVVIRREFSLGAGMESLPATERAA